MTIEPDLRELEDQLRSEYDGWSPGAPDRASIASAARSRAGSLRRRRNVTTSAVAAGAGAAIAAAAVFAGQLTGGDSTSTLPGSKASTSSQTSAPASGPLDAAALLPGSIDMGGLEYHAKSEGSGNTARSAVRAGREPKVAGQICSAFSAGGPRPISSINDWTDSSPTSYYAMNAIASYTPQDAVEAFRQAKALDSPCSWSDEDQTGTKRTVTVGSLPGVPSDTAFTVTQGGVAAVTVVHRVDGYLISSMFANNLVGSTSQQALRLKAQAATNTMIANLRTKGLVK